MKNLPSTISSKLLRILVMICIHYFDSFWNHYSMNFRVPQDFIFAETCTVHCKSLRGIIWYYAIVSRETRSDGAMRFLFTSIHHRSRWWCVIRTMSTQSAASLHWAASLHLCTWHLPVRIRATCKCIRNRNPDIGWNDL